MVEKMKQILIIIIGLFLLTNFAQAFQASTDYGSYSLCSCSDVVYKVDVTNDDSYLSDYKISFQGDLKNFVTSTPDFLRLKPGQKGEFYVFVKLPCNWYGDKILQTTITSNTDSKTFSQNFNLEKCETIETELRSFSEDSCQCENFDYSLLLKNPSEFEEEYTFNIEGMENVTLPENVTLNAGRSTLLTVSLSPPCRFNKEKVDLEISTKYTKQTKTLELPITYGEDCEDVKTPIEFNWMYVWYSLGGVVVILLIIFIVYLVKRPAKEKVEKVEKSKRPKLVSLAVTKKERKWPKYLSRIFFILLIIGLAVLAYIYIPKLFVVEGVNDTVVATNVTGVTEETGVNLGYWFYVIIGVVALAVVDLLIYLLRGKRGSFKRFLLKLVITLIVLAIVLCLAYMIWVNWYVIWQFIKLYWVYMIIGFVLLILIIIFGAIVSKRNNKVLEKVESQNFVCQYCGKDYKTLRGLENHKKRSH